MDKISKNKLGIDVVFKFGALFHGKSTYFSTVTSSITNNFDSGFRFRKSVTKDLMKRICVFTY